jgi:exopolyphosphatase/guanosine-5'-triphosphate,3'-diphosphate pyrophosphatase
VANRSKNRHRAALYAASPKALKSSPIKHPHTTVNSAKGRLDHGPPIAVIDIGSNSVRLVIYEGLTRSPTPIFNEKVLAGLGRQVQSTGLLAGDAIDTALDALKRFRALCDILHVRKIWAIATAACRDARNGRAFIAEAARICRTPIKILSGKREAHLTALGIVSGIHKPDGIVGDLGGGSLELVDVHGTRVRGGMTLPFGGLALQDITGKSLKKAEKIVEEEFEDLEMLHDGEGRTFYAVGGTWRALARLHMWQTGYPFHVMHNYRISAREALEFSRLVHRVDTDTLSKIEVVNAARRPLLAYAALVLENLVRTIKPKQVIFSVHGVREGLLYSLLKSKERMRDPLISAAADLNVLRSRSPHHGEELIEWTDRFMASSGLSENAEERRLRHAACLLGDIGWRAHPDYRGEQSMNIIAHGAFVSIDHPGRAYLALSVYFRHAGLSEEELSPRLRELATTRMLDRARVLGAAMRVAYILTAGQSGVLPKAPMQVKRGKLVLKLRGRIARLESERVFSRLRQLARLVGRDPVIET